MNGTEVGFVRTPKEAGAFPLGTGMPAPDSDVTFLTFRADVGREYTVKFYL